jgi:hypothetical protein
MLISRGMQTIVSANRTQEVGGSNPPSSIGRIPHQSADLGEVRDIRSLRVCHLHWAPVPNELEGRRRSQEVGIPRWHAEWSSK